MSEKTRLKIGIVFLLSLSLLSVPVSFLAVRLEAGKQGQHWTKTSKGLALKNVNSLERGIAFLTQRDGISRQAAERIAYQTQRETKTRLTESDELPYGAQLDYFTVDGTGDIATARYEGSATVLDPRSQTGHAFLTAVQQYAHVEKKPEITEYLAQSLKKGVLLAPLSWVTGDLASMPIRAGSGGIIRPAATATPLRIAVICTKFPAFRDVSPRSNGDLNANDTARPSIHYTTGAVTPAQGSITEAVYRQELPDSLDQNRYNFATVADAPPGGDLPFPNSIFDTPGGVFSAGAANWGVPMGTPQQWDWVYPAVNPHPSRENNIDLQNYMYDMLMDQSSTAFSLSNFIYQQTHGAYRFHGERTDVIGWLFSGHWTNRYNWQTGGGNEFFILPGTPVIREQPISDGDYAPDKILRATLSPRGCTILFGSPVYNLNINSVNITAFTTVDTNVEVAGTQPGNVNIVWGGASGTTYTLVMDPYDARRWTIGNPGGTGWKFQTQHSDPASRTWVSFVSPDNGNWTLSVAGWTNVANYTRNQRRGCPQLTNTTLTATDMRVAPPAGGTSLTLDRPKNRLRHLNYYTRAFVPDINSHAYQISHMRNEFGFDDDISGTVVPALEDYRSMRPVPWDHEANDPDNKGYWPTLGEENAGNHRFGTYAGDAAKILADNGISLTGYQRVVHVNAGSNWVQPISSLYLNEYDGALVYFHEFAHTIGAFDLYDMDFVVNKQPPLPVPPFHECPAMDPYSVMGMGGARLDAYHQVQLGWTQKSVITRDTLGLEIPEVEGWLRDPVIIKIPGNPYYIKENTPEANWKEYFLLENRNTNSSNGPGAYQADGSPKGLYIYHIDERGAAKFNLAEGGFQRDDQLLTCIVEQADGLYELEFNDKGNFGNMQTDPFGADTAARVSRFWQWPMMNGELNDSGLPVQNVSSAGSPTSFSHGYTYAEQSGGQNIIIPGTETDSFVRVVRMSNRGQVMTADVYVEPAEIIATATSLMVNGGTVVQGQKDVGVMRLTLQNPDGVSNPNNYAMMSTKDVFVDTLRLLESGTSNDGRNVSAVKLYVDGNGNGTFEPAPGGADTLLATTTIDTSGTFREHAVFSNLGYRVPLGETRNLFFAYDIAPEAQTNPRITVGGEFTDASKIIPRLPGSVQRRVRNNAKFDFGTLRFPLLSNTNVIVGFPDRLVMTPATFASVKASQGQVNVPLLKINCEVNPNDDTRQSGTLRLDSIVVDQIGSLDAVTGVANCRLFVDINKNGRIDGTDVQLGGDSTFTPQLGTNGRATFTSLNYTLNAGAANAVDLIVAASLTPGATVGSTLQLSLEFPTPGGQPQDCYVQLINNPNESDANKDYVEWDDQRGGVWPMRSAIVDVITPNTAPNPPVSGFDPTGGVEIADQTPLLSWDAASDPDPLDTPETLHYEVEVSSSAAFASIAASGSTAAGVINFQVPAGTPLDYDTTYYWHVRTVDAQGGTSVWSATQSFRVVQNRPPNAVSSGFYPSGGLQITDPTPDLLWDATTDPDANDTPASLTYEVTLDDNNDFSSPTFTGTTPAGQTTINVNVTLNIGVTYYWRVRALDAKGREGDPSGISEWSATQNFRVVVNQPPNTPVAPFVPSGGVEITTANPVITWNSPVPADPNPTDTVDTIRYELQLSDQSDLSSGPYIFTFTTAEDTRTATVATVNLQDDVQYFYRLRAIDRGGLQSAWTAVQDFWVNLENDPPNPPLSGFWPLDGSGISDETPRLSWDAATDPDISDTPATLRYQVQLSRNGFATVAYTYSTPAGQTFADVTTPLTDLTNWSWRVRTVDDDGATSVWSVVNAFYLDVANQPPSAPTSGFNPTGGRNVSDLTPLLTWDPATDPDPLDTPETLAYEIEVCSDISFAPDSGYYLYAGTGQGQSSLQIPDARALTAGVRYYWRVRTLDDSRVRSGWSAVQQFVIGANQPPNAVTSGFAPAGGVSISDLTPLLQWDAASDPDANDTPDTLRYQVMVDDNSDFSSPHFTGTTAVGITELECTTPLAVGVRYYWRVRTIDAAGATSSWSARQNFRTIANRAPFAPQAPFTPANGLEVNTANPTIQWSMPDPPDPDVNDTIDVIRYQVQLNDKADLANGPYIFSTTTAVNVQEAICAANLEDNKQYWYRVRAIDPGGLSSDWSAVQNFWVNLENQAPNPPDSGFVPVHGSSIANSRPTLSWNPANDPDPYDTAATLHYVVQLSRDNFATVSYQYTTADGETQVDVTNTLTDLTTWQWRVRTVDNDGAQSVWSTVQEFYLDTNNQPPVFSDPLVMPLYGALANYFELYVTYTDAENDQPGIVRCAFDNGAVVREMSKVNPADNNARDGIRYVVGIQGSVLGLGPHTHVFTSESGARLPQVGEDLGPIIGTPSNTQFTDAAGTPQVVYEEGQPVHIRVRDDDQNLNPAVAETITVVVTEPGGDSETVVLTETGNNTNIFRGSLPTLGRAGENEDGVLNVIAGPDGAQITATYTDPDDGANPTPDRSIATATVRDTVAPARIDRRVTATSGPHGRTAILDWSAYDEAAQVDVAGYHVFYSTTDFTDTSGLTSVATLPAGTFTYEVTGLTPNRPYFFAVSAFDEVPNERLEVTTRRLVTEDSSAPTISSQVPGPGATEVARNTSVSFLLSDPGVGVDRSTLAITLTQNGNPVPFTGPTFSGNNNALTVTVTPTDPLLWNGVVEVTVHVADLSGNVLDTNWSFSLVTDPDGPTIDQQSPAPGAANVTVGSSVSFHAKDSKSGIDAARTVVLFNGVDVSADLSFGGSASDTTVLYDPPDSLAYSTTYTVSATIYDVAGNQHGPVVWQFSTVVDNSAVTADQFVPARNATGVPVDTNISLRLSDAQAGIRVNTLRLWVNGTEVTNSPNLTITQTPAAPASPSTMTLTYDPPANLPFGSDVQVRVYVEDEVGNVADISYKFTTANAPTYNISGQVTTAAGDPIAGVQVAAGGQTTVTDGAGGYRLMGLLAGNYTVTVTRDQYVFTPVSRAVTLGPDDAVGVDFEGRLLTYSLRGRVTEGTVGVAGVEVEAQGVTVTTDAQGNYVIPNLPNGRYNVTPSLLNYHFQPTSRAADINGADVTGVNFQAIADTFSVSGTITDNAGNRVSGVRVTDATGQNVAVSNAAGVYVLSGLRAGTYTLIASRSGYSLDPPSHNVTVPPDQTTVDFTAYLEMSNQFPAGINFIGIPGAPLRDNPVDVFGTGLVYRWDPDARPGRYVVGLNEPTSSVLRVRAGKGYFVNLPANGSLLRVAGTPTDTTRTHSIGLSEGWNMIANPMPGPTPFGNFVPSVPNGIRPFAFALDPATGSYVLVSDTPTVNATRTSLLSWEGAWVRATVGGVSLLVTASSSPAAAQVKPQQADLQGGWVIPVVARAGSRGDFTSVAGVVPGSGDSHCIDNPPTAPATVDVYFVNTAGRRLAHDIRSQDGSQTYEFVVACQVPDTDVTVSLPDLSLVPASQQIMLTDVDTGKTLYARTLSGYTYRSAGESSQRNFRLTVSPRTVGALTLSATAASAQGGNVMLTYSVTKACQVSARVMNVAGRCVRTLTSDKLVTAGVQSEVWNLRSDSGTRVPPGTYLLQIEATTQDGQRVRGLTQINIGR
jgi:hypothetical protein